MLRRHGAIKRKAAAILRRGFDPNLKQALLHTPARKASRMGGRLQGSAMLTGSNAGRGHCLGRAGRNVCGGDGEKVWRTGADARVVLTVRDAEHTPQFSTGGGGGDPPQLPGTQSRAGRIALPAAWAAPFLEMGEGRAADRSSAKGTGRRFRASTTV